jgi:hypothetical protein
MTNTTIRKTTARLFTVAALLLLAGCMRDPYLYGYYPPLPPPPLQPYVEPAIAAPPAHRRVVRHRHHRRTHHKPLCPCAQPVQ